MAIQSPVVISPSRLLLIGLLGFAGVALAALATVPSPAVFRGTVMIGIAMLTGVGARQVLLQTRSSISAIVPLNDGRCILRNGSRAEIYAAIQPDSVTWPWTLQLSLKEEGSQRSMVVLLMRDSVSSVDWRRLSIWLRWQANGPNA